MYNHLMVINVEIDDPVSTRILEKRRRDRMNNCLADLSSLIPSTYLKEGKGRIEKIEIIEMAIKHIKDLTSIIANKQDGLTSSLPDRYLGFKECQDEVMRYLVEVENWDAQDQLCSRMMIHLEQAGEKFRIMNDASLSQAKKEEKYWDVEMDTCSLRSKKSALEDRGSDTPMQICRNLQRNQKLESPQPILSSRQRFWTLPTIKRKNTGGVEDSGLSTDQSSSASNGTDNGMKYLNYENDLNGSLHEPVPTLSESSSLTSMENVSDNGNNLYKFKDRFTKRFSEEVTRGKNNLSDSSSVSSKENHQMQCDTVKRKFGEIRSRSPCSTGSSHSPQSGSSNNNSCSNGESVSSGDDEIKSCYLPGFVLHPVGSHYIPLSINSSNVDYNIFTKAAEQESVGYHPIRILVNFGGPLIHMQNFAIDSNSVGSAVQSLSLESSDNDSPLSCSSENSINPESEVVTNSP